ncbi:hypothetical protein [Gryllotalpicola ginsengisoli]|uniref:hypothetical protein n=1 Tax=Gryllotalpicola ginsengisoli TaxID=444608 RepID=UPI0003B3E6A1|nr:hypothetical protein [Gryllotalpicola ginsengisoli]
MLWLRGAVSFLTAPASDRVTITGARAATGYGEYVATEEAGHRSGSLNVAARC